MDGPLTEKYCAGEVDVVQLVAVDETTGRDVADHRVVLPTVPQSADDLDDVAGLVEQVRPGDVPAAEQLGLVFRTADPHLPAGPAVGDEVKRGNGFGDVEWLRMGDGGDRNEADVSGHRRDPRGNQNRVGPACQPARLDLGSAAPLRGERVVKGHEVQQPALGGDDEIRPVASAGDGLGVLASPPGLGMPAVSVECDSQVHGLGHDTSVFRNARG